MSSAVGHMSCLICGRQWEVEALLASDSAYVIPDDLCPECGAQGEPLSVSASPVATTRIERVSPLRTPLREPWPPSPLN